MRQSLRGMLLGAAALTMTSSIAFAGEEHLEFKFVIKALDPLVLQAANVDGQTMTATKAFGVALFKDGRIAVKDFIGSSETRNGNGPMRGFSTYTFEDGSSITASYVGEYNDGVGKGTYIILSGTGIYANATGTGGFDSVPSKFKGASLLNGRLDVKTP